LEVLVFVERVVVFFSVVGSGRGRTGTDRSGRVASSGDVSIAVDARVVDSRAVTSSIVTTREFLGAVRAVD